MRKHCKVHGKKVTLPEGGLTELHSELVELKKQNAPKIVDTSGHSCKLNKKVAAEILAKSVVQKIAQINKCINCLKEKKRTTCPLLDKQSKKSKK